MINLFLKFSDSPLSVEVIRIYFPPALKRMGGTMLSTSSCYFMKFVSNIVWQFSTTKTIPLVINFFIYLQTQYQIQKCPDDAKVKKVKDRIGTR